MRRTAASGAVAENNLTIAPKVFNHLSFLVKFQIRPLRMHPKRAIAATNAAITTDKPLCPAPVGEFDRPTMTASIDARLSHQDSSHERNGPAPDCPLDESRFQR